MKLFSVIFALSLLCRSDGIELECEFTESNALDLDASIYGHICYLRGTQLITSGSNRSISSLKAKIDESATSISADGIKTFKAFDCAVTFIPRGLTKYFKNLQNLVIVSSGLKKLSRYDLGEFGENLKSLVLNLNEIEVIEAKAFKFNKNLELINLADNKIKQIGAETFGESGKELENLRNLKSLWLHGNFCTTSEDHATNDRTKALQVVRGVDPKCKKVEGNS